MSTPSIYSRPKNEWLKWIDGSGSETQTFNVVDSSGNMYTVGATTSTTLYVGDSSSATSYTTPYAGCFLAKHDSSGNLVWIIRVYDTTGTGVQNARAVTLSSDQSYVYITGNTTSTSISVVLNNGSPTSYPGGTVSSARDIFILKFSTSTGAFATNANGDSWIGWLNTNAGVKSSVWIATDNSDNLNVLFVSDNPTASIKYSYNSTTSSYLSQAFTSADSFSQSGGIFQLNSLGVPQWLNWISGYSSSGGTTGGTTELQNIIVDNTNSHIYIGGNTTKVGMRVNNITFAGVSTVSDYNLFSATSVYTVYIIRLSATTGLPSGNVIGINGNAADYLYPVLQLDTNKNLVFQCFTDSTNVISIVSVVAGAAVGSTTTLGPAKTTSTERSVFVARLNTSSWNTASTIGMNFKWITGNNTVVTSYDTLTDSNNNIYLSGTSAAPSLIIDGVTYTFTGATGNNAYMIKLDTNFNVLWVKLFYDTLSSSNHEYMYKLSLGPNNEIYASGIGAASTIIFNGITYTNRPAGGSGNGSYVLKVSQEEPLVLQYTGVASGNTIMLPIKNIATTNLPFGISWDWTTSKSFTSPGTSNNPSYTYPSTPASPTIIAIYGDFTLFGVSSTSETITNISKLTSVIKWDEVASLTSLYGAFMNATSLTSVPTALPSLVTNISNTFKGATSFNSSNVTSWNTSAITNMSSTFNGATSFNQNISTWTTSAVTDMSSMFNGASGFNQNISTWTTSAITDMSSMFNGATSFNQNISSWATSTVTNMSSMFNGATSFNQDLSAWSLASITTMANMFTGVTLSTTNYTSILVGWYAQTPPLTITFSGGSSKYNTTAFASRSSLISARSWTITDGGLDTSTLTNPMILTYTVISPSNLIITLPLYGTVNSYVSWGDTNADYYTTTGDKTHTFTSAGSYTVYIGNTSGTSLTQFGNGSSTYLYADRLTGVTTFGSNGLTSLSGAFRGATNLASVTSTLPTTVTNLSYTFYGATNTGYHATIASWNVSNVTTMANMFTDVTISVTNYNAILTAWVLLTLQSGVTFDAGTSTKYSTSGVVPRNSIKTNYTWTINDGGFDNTTLSNPMILTYVVTSPSNLIITLPLYGTVNAYVSWNDTNADYYTTTGDKTHTYTSAGTYTVYIGNTSGTSLTQFGNGSSTYLYADRLTGVTTFGSIGLTSLSGAFQNATSLISVPTSLPTTITNLSYCFQGANSFNSSNIINWNTSSVTNMTSMFNGATTFNQDLVPATTGSMVFLGTIASYFKINVASETDFLFGTGDITVEWWQYKTDTQATSRMFAFTNTGATVLLFGFNIYSNGDVRCVSNGSSYIFGTLPSSEYMNKWVHFSLVRQSGVLKLYKDGVQYGLTFSDTSNLAQPAILTVANDVNLGGAGSFSYGGNLTNFHIMKGVAFRTGNFDVPTTPATPNAYSVLLLLSQSSTTMFDDATTTNRKFVNEIGSVTWSSSSALTSYSAWNTASVTTMESMFESASAFNGTIEAWNVTAVTNFNNMFKSAIAFNKAVNNWTLNTSTSTTMISMFQGATTYNKLLGLWDTSKITNMSSMFEGATQFMNGVASSGSIYFGGVSTSYMTIPNSSDPDFALGTGDFTIEWWQNQIYNASNTSTRIFSIGTVGSDVKIAFSLTNIDANSYSVILIINNASRNFGTISTTNLTNKWLHFAIVRTLGAIKVYINGVPVGSVWNDANSASSIASSTIVFTIGNQTSRSLASSYNGYLTNFHWVKGTALYKASFIPNSNQISVVANTKVLLLAATLLTRFTDSSVSPKTISGTNVIWNSETPFTINNWTTSLVTNMSSMFKNATNFNMSIYDWDTSAVTNMSSMFNGATSYNFSMNVWNTALVTNMSSMFNGATSFNGTINSWNTSAVTDMSNMFNGAITFNKDLSAWNISSITTMANMFNNSNLSTTVYSAILVGWYGQTPPISITFGASSIKYDITAVSSRNSLISLRSWTITDGGFDNTTLSNPMILTYTVTSPSNLIITLPLDGTVNTYASWGDTNADYYTTTGDKTHTYSSAGTYTVYIGNTSGTALTQFGRGSSTYLYADRLTGVTSFGSIGLTSLSGAFRDATSLSSVTSTFPSTITNLSYTFYGATNTGYHSTLGSWDVKNVTTMANILTNVTVSKANYDLILTGWAALASLTSGVTFNIGSTKYSYTSYSSRQTILSRGWTLVDGGLDSSNAMILTFSVTSPSNLTITLPLYGTVSCLVDWGDSSTFTSYSTTGDKTHTYASTGTYTVSIIGSLTQFGNDSSTYLYADRLTGVTTFGSIGLTSLSGAFRGATNLTSVASTLPTTVTNLSHCFYGATNTGYHATIASWNVSNVTTMSNMFTNVTISVTNYNAILTAWALLTLQSNVTFDAGSSTKYSFDGVAPRNTIKTTYSWTINDGGFDTSLLSNPMSLSYTVTSPSNLTITLPLYGTVNAYVSWDDTNANYYNTTGDKTHTYTSAGTYTVYIGNSTGITPVLTQFGNGSSTYTNAARLVSVVSFGSIGLASLSGAFRDTTSLTSVPSSIPSSITNTSYMFYGATSFNQNIDNWNTSSITNMSYMFYGATTFNQRIKDWTVTSVTNMSNMFYGAIKFNQNLSSWNISSVTDMSNMFDSSGLSSINYTYILIGWGSLVSVQPNVTLGAASKQYYTNAINYRNTLTNSPNTWTINDGGSLGTFIPASKISPPYRYYKWLITAVRTAPETVSVGEFRFYDQTKIPINIGASSYTITNPDGVNPSGYEVAKLTDDDEFTYWSDTNAPNGYSSRTGGYIIFDLGSDYNLKKAPYYYSWVTSSDSSGRDPITWGLYGSTDNSTWILIDQQTSYSVPTQRNTEVTLSIDGENFFNNGLTGGSIFYSTNGALNCKLTVPYSSDLSLGTGDFTVEFFHYYLTPPSLSAVFFVISTGAVYVIMLRYVGLSSFQLYLNSLSSSGSVSIASSSLLNRWTHYAIVRIGTSVKLYINGVARISITSSADLTNTSYPLIIGNQNTATSDGTAGYFTNFHWIKGTGKYTGNFTVPTYPIIPISDTKLLLLAKSSATAFTDSSAVPKTITNNNTVWNSLTPFTTTNDFTLQYNNVANTNVIMLPIKSIVTSVSVNWGDGTTTTETTNNPTHTYSNSTPSTYYITITGNFAQFGTSSSSETITNISKLVAVTSFGTSSSLTSLEGAFQNATSLISIPSSISPNITNLSRAFYGATLINDSNIQGWDVSSVTNFSYMFYNATTFNQSINNWALTTSVSNNVNMSYMFSGTTGFNQSLASWNISRVNNMTNMFQGVTLSTANYSATLVGWYSTAQSSITFSGGSSKYNTTAVSSRNSFVNTKSWTITDGGFDTSSLSNPMTLTYTVTSPSNLIIALPLYGTVNAYVSWGDTKADYYNTTGDKTHTYASAGTYTVYIGNTSNNALTQFGNNSTPYNYATRLVAVVSFGVIGLTSLSGAFLGATNLASVTSTFPTTITDLSHTFSGATNTGYHATLASWNVSNVTTMDGIFTGVTVSQTNYNSILVGWAALVSLTSGVTFSVNTTTYSTTAISARQTILSRGWTLVDGGLNTSLLYNPMILTYSVTAPSNLTITLPLYGTVNAYVSWGDTTSDYYTTTGDKTHLYTATGTYTVHIGYTSAGNALTQFGNGATGYANADHLTGVTSFGITGLTSLSGAFKGAINLASVASSLPSTITNLSYCFYGATNTGYHATIASWDVSNVTTLANAFTDVTISATNYNVILTSWALLTLQTGVTFDAGSLTKYTGGGVAPRNTIITNYSWTINDGGFDTSILSNPMRITVTVASPNLTVTLPLYGTVNTYVSWGDSAASYYNTTGDKTHTYSADGYYYIYIGNTSGTALTQFGHGSSTYANADRIYEVTTFGNIGLTSLSGAFRNATNLSSMTPTLPSSITNLSYCFYGATNTGYMSPITAWNVTNVTTMVNMFTNVTIPTSIYDTLLTNWSGQTLQLNVTLDAGSSTKYITGYSYKNSIISTYGWTINDGGFDTTFLYSPMILVYTVTSPSNLTITLPLYGTVNTYVAWGDSFADFYNTTGDKSHTYISAGTYTVQIGNTTMGTALSQFGNGSSTYTNASRLVEVTSFGNMGLTSLSGAFRDATNLATIPSSLQPLTGSTYITDLSYAFYGATNTGYHSTIANWNITNVTDMTSMLTGVTIATATYDTLLTNWAGQMPLQSNVTFDAGLSKYYFTGVAPRNTLISTYNWTITDGGFDESGLVDAFTLVYTVTAPSNLTITLPLYGSVNVYVVWGDSNITHVTSVDDVSHTYASAGTYTVKITGTLTQFGKSIFTYANADRLVSVTTFGSIGLLYLRGAFRDAVNLASIPSTLPSTITDLSDSFRGATNTGYHSTIASWDISNVTIMTDMFRDVTIATTTYNNILTAWASLSVQSGVIFSAGDLTKYSIAGITPRNTLTSTYTWMITDGGFDTTTLSNPMVLTYTLASPGTITLPLYGTVNAYVSWGDTSASYYNTTGDKTHYYSSSGTYTVYIGNILGVTPALTQFGNGVTGYANPELLAGVTTFGLIGLTSLSGAFKGATALTSVPSSLPSTVTNLTHTFNGATNTGYQSTIASWDISNVTDMTAMFANVTLETPSYNAILTAWALLSVQSNVTFNAGPLSLYSIDGVIPRNTLTTTYNWTIIDAGFSSTELYNPMTIIVTVTSPSNLSVTLPLYGTVNAYVAWGDTTVSYYSTTGDKTHIYTSAGTYIIQIGNKELVTPVITQFGNGSSSYSNVTNIDNVMSFGDIGLTSLSGAFNGATNLSEVSSTLPSTIIDLSYCFKGATNSGYLTGFLNWDISNVTTMANIFTDVTIATATYTQMLENWTELTLQNNVVFDAGSSTKYSGFAVFHRESIKSTYNWTINDGGYDVSTLYNPMILTYTITSPSNLTITLPLYGTVNTYVSWGDTNASYYDSMGNKTHTYTSLGTYTVYLGYSSSTTALTQFGNGVTGYDDSDLLTGVTTFGSIGLISLSGAFKDAINLTSIPSTLPASITDLTYTFYEATNTGYHTTLANWDVSNVSAMNFMLYGVTLSVADYDALLYAWSLLTLQSFVNFHAGNSKYSLSSGYPYRFSIISGHEWTITDGGFDTSPFNDPIILEYVVTSPSNLTITLPLYGTVNVYVDWSDSTISNYTTTGDKTHTYASAGTYTVKIYGTLTQFGNGSSTYSHAARLQRVLDFGECGLTSLSGAFNGATSLIEVPTSLPTTSTITNLSYCFKNATSFTSQSLGTWDVSSVTNMTQMFNGVTMATLIYDDLLSGWSSLPVLSTSVSFDGGNSKYSFGTPRTNKNYIISTYSWTFTDGGIDPTTLTNPMILEYVVSGTNLTITLPLYNTVNVTVVWGDSLDNNYTTTGNKDHTYSTTGTKTVYIVGTLKQFGNGTNSVTNAARLSRVLSFGEVGLISLNGAFYQCSSLTEVPSSLPTTSTVTILESCFQSATTFNHANIISWNVSAVTSIANMFNTASAFNQDISGWTVTNVTNMNGTFRSAIVFNKNIGIWDTSNVTEMNGTFRGASSFNQNIGNWDIGKVTTAFRMFFSCPFNYSLANWNPISLVDGDEMFSGALSTANYNATLISWSGKTLLSGSIIDFGTSVCTYGTASDARWYIRTNFSWTLKDGGVTSLPAPMVLTVNIPLASDLKIRLPLYGQTDTIVDWGDSSTTEYLTNGNKEHTYASAGIYTIQITRTLTQFGNGSSTYLYVDRITEVTSFGGIRLTSLTGAFNGASSLTSVPTSLPTTSTMTNLSYCFKNATSFASSNITSWNVSSVTNMTSMFEGATSFNMDISGWNIANVQLMNNMFLSVTIPRATYDAILNGWSALPSLQSSVNFHGGSSKYSYGLPLTNRQYIIDTYSWTITDGGIDPTTLTDPMILEYVVTSPSNLTITLPLQSTVNAIVIWGDSQSDEYTTVGNKTHTYTSAGTYTVYIGGIVTQFGNGLTGYTNADRLQRVLDWGIIGLTSLSGAFNGATSLIEVPATLPTTSNITNLSYCFKGATTFNDVNVASWVVQHVTNMISMFEDATAFNQPVGNWENHMANVLYMNSMFKNATSFNQNLGAWNVSNVLIMDSMFEGTISFDQDIGTWDVSSVTSMINMFLGVTLSTVNYDALLNGWRALPSLQSNVNFHGGSSKYTYGTTSDNRLYIKKNYNWTITDGGVVLATLPPPMSLTYTITNPLSRTVTLPLYGTVDVIVDWGDMTSNEYDTTGDKTHTYASIGTYTVLVNKTLSQFGSGSSSYTNADKLVSVGSFGGIRLTSLSGAFNGASALTSVPVTLPTTTTVTDLSYCFKGATSFNDSNVIGWDVSSITNMISMFENASTFDQDISGWDVSNVQTMDDFIKGGMLSLSNYDALLLGWKLLSLYNDVNFHGGNSMYSYGLAAQARLYIQSTYNWNFTDGGIEPTTLPPAMELVFEVDPSTSMIITLPLFGTVDVIINWGDGNIEICTTPGYLDHTYLMSGTYTVTIKNILTQFGNGLTGYPNSFCLKQVNSFGELLLTSLSGAFMAATSLVSVPLTLPTTSSITDLSYCFRGASIFNDVNIIGWDVSTVTDMTRMFEYATSFNQNLHDWDTSNVTSMKGMFKLATSYNNNNSVSPDTINKWDTALVTDMSEMFSYCYVFNQPLSSWNTSNVTNMSLMFFQAGNFNQPLNNWDTSSVTDMSEMFREATNFNQDLNNWNTSLVTLMQYMFFQASAFDGNINNWNTSLVTDMSYMFYGAIVFNQNISNWNTSLVTNMSNSFREASQFNQDISRWNTSNVTNMANMFYDANNFNQNLANLSIISINTDFEDIFSNTSLSSLNYTRTLIGWAAQVTIIQTNLVMNTNGKQYYDDAVTAHNILTSAPYSWTINDGGSLGTSIPGTTNTGFRYYSLIITQTRSLSDYVHASELVFYDENKEKIDISSYSIVNVNGNNPVGNEATKLIDNNPFTDWVDLNGPRGGIKLGGQVIIDFGVDFATKVKPMYYSYYSANDNSERDPKSWILYCSLNMIKLYNISKILGYVAATKRNYEVTSSIDGENYFTITYPPDPAINRSIYRVNAGESITLPLFGTVNVTIDWGDSTIETVNVSGMKSHTYAIAGDYIVQMTGNLEQLGNGLDGYPNADKLISMTSFGYLGITSLSGVFKDAVNLESCPDFIPTTVTNLEYAFYGATKINDPLILEWDLTNVVDISYMFFNATSFNQNIFVWNPINLVHKRFFLYGASSFSQPISGWLQELQDEQV